jgi:hypothetical protein
VVDASNREALPDNIGRLVDEIEAFAGLSIKVVLIPKVPSPTDPNPDSTACQVTEDSATIIIRSEWVQPEAILHELLHIQRYLVEGIPQVHPILGEKAPEGNWQILNQIENELEHLVIVPRMADYGFEPYDYWNKTEQRNWSRYPWPENTVPWDRRRNCLRGSLAAAFIVTDPEVKQLIEKGIAQEGLLTETRLFTAKIRSVLDSKPRAIAAFLRFLPLAYKEVTVVRFDVKNRKRVVVPLPMH